MEDVPEGMGGWIVVNTHPHREEFATGHLINQKFDVYCPKMRKTLRKREGLTEVLRPLFPSYIFVRADRHDRGMLRPILSTRGVRRVVRFGDQTPGIEGGFIEGLRAREVDGAVLKPEQPYSVGQSVRIVGGAFDGVIARIVQVEPNERLTILMDLLGQSIRGRIKADQVSALLERDPIRLNPSDR